MAEQAKLESPDRPTDVLELVPRVLRESYLAANEELVYYSAKVKFINAHEKEIQEEIKKARQRMEEYLSYLEHYLDAIGDDAQLANVDMQNMLQKQQQTLARAQLYTVSIIK